MGPFALKRSPCEWELSPSTARRTKNSISNNDEVRNNQQHDISLYSHESKSARLASQFNLSAENNATMPDNEEDYFTEDEDEQTHPNTILAKDVLEGSEPVQISHAGGEFYELVRDEIRKQSKCVHNLRHSAIYWLGYQQLAEEGSQNKTWSRPTSTWSVCIAIGCHGARVPEVELRRKGWGPWRRSWRFNLRIGWNVWWNIWDYGIRYLSSVNFSSVMLTI